MTYTPEDMYDQMLNIPGATDLTWLFNQRGIVQEYQREALSDYGILHITDSSSLAIFDDQKTTKDFGLFKNNYCLMQGRYIIPVYGISGKLLTFVGWYPDQRKYLVMRSKYFGKNTDWFNIDKAYQKSLYTDGIVFVVEGMFDAIMLDILGLPAIAAMGSHVNASKSVLLTMFKRAVVIPDADKVGQSALKKWHIPIEHKLVTIPEKKIQLSDTITKTIKDPDDLVKYYPREELKAMLLDVANTSSIYKHITLPL